MAAHSLNNVAVNSVLGGRSNKMPKILVAADEKAEFGRLYQEWAGPASMEEKRREPLEPEPIVWTPLPVSPRPYVVIPMEIVFINHEFAEFLTERDFPFEII
jgi:hypothetical protein